MVKKGQLENIDLQKGDVKELKAAKQVWSKLFHYEK